MTLAAASVLVPLLLLAVAAGWAPSAPPAAGAPRPTSRRRPGSARGRARRSRTARRSRCRPSGHGRQFTLSQLCTRRVVRYPRSPSSADPPRSPGGPLPALPRSPSPWSPRRSSSPAVRRSPATSTSTTARPSSPSATRCSVAAVTRRPRPRRRLRRRSGITLDAGYPTGVILPLVAIGRLIDVDLGWAYMPYLAVLAGMLATAIAVVLRPLVARGAARPLRRPAPQGRRCCSAS